jgi:hypothetical protein
MQMFCVQKQRVSPCLISSPFASANMANISFWATHAHCQACTCYLPKNVWFMNLPSCKIVLHESEFFGIQTKFTPSSVVGKCCSFIKNILQPHVALHFMSYKGLHGDFGQLYWNPQPSAQFCKSFWSTKLKFNRFLRIQITTFFLRHWAQNDQRPNYNHIKNHHTCPWTYIAWHLVSFFPGFYIHSSSTNLSTPLQNNIHLEKRKNPFLTWHLRSRVLI